MKKILSLLVLLSLLVSLFAGCVQRVSVEETATTEEGSNVETVTEEKPEPVTLTVYSQLANYSGQLTGWFGKELLDRFNAEVIIVPDVDGVYDTRMEAGNLGDIVIWGADGEDYLGAVEAGLLFDWNQDDLLAEYGPYINENMQPALGKNMDVSGGTLYGFGHNVATSSEDHENFFYTWDIRWDLYKELGYPEINDLDDLVEVMAMMKEIAPTDDVGDATYAVSLWPDWDGSMVMYVKAMATAYYGYDELGIGLYNVENGEFYDALDPEGPYLEALKFFNNLYQRDLLDPDSMIQTFDEVTAKVQNGGTFFSIFNFAGNAAFNSDTHIDENKIMLTLTPNEATPLAYGMNILGGNRIWSIGAKTQYPELCMEIINWLATPEGRMVSEYGPQGITWDYDAEGYTVPTELGRLMHNDRTTSFPEETGYYGEFNDGANQMNNTTWSLDSANPDSNGETYNWDSWKANKTEPRNDTEADWRAYFGYDDIQSYLNSKPYKLALGTSYSESKRSDELKVVWEQVIKAVKDYSWRAIYAETDDEFDALVKEMTFLTKQYGYDKCVEWSEGEAARRKELEDALRNK